MIIARPAPPAQLGVNHGESESTKARVFLARLGTRNAVLVTLDYARARSTAEVRTVRRGGQLRLGLSPKREGLGGVGVRVCYFGFEGDDFVPCCGKKEVHIFGERRGLEMRVSDLSNISNNNKKGMASVHKAVQIFARARLRPPTSSA